jgi:hypothetical protein
MLPKSEIIDHLFDFILIFFFLSSSAFAAVNVRFQPSSVMSDFIILRTWSLDMIFFFYVSSSFVRVPQAYSTLSFLFV